MIYDFAIMQERRSPLPLYRSGAHCPACDAAKWHVGRFSAECASCGAALPLAPVPREPAPAIAAPAWANRP